MQYTHTHTISLKLFRKLYSIAKELFLTRFEIALNTRAITVDVRFCIGVLDATKSKIARRRKKQPVVTTRKPSWQWRNGVKNHEGGAKRLYGYLPLP